MADNDNDVIALAGLVDSSKTILNGVTPKSPKGDIEVGVGMWQPFVTPYRNAWEVYRDDQVTAEQLVSMRRTDGQARALFRLIVLPIRAALSTCTFVPAAGQKGGQDEATFVEQMFTMPASQGGMMTPWTRVISQVLNSVFDGFAPFELVYWSPKKGPLKGKWTLKKMAWRPPQTIYFLLDKNGNFWGFRQRVMFMGRYIDVEIPPDSAVYHACFSGDTKVALLDGTSPTMAELAQRHASDEQLWTYSIDHKGMVVPGNITAAGVTGHRKVIEIELDNGERVRCTADHRWMLRDGTYTEAGTLQPGDSLMPLYRRDRPVGRSKSPYEQVYLPGENRWQFTHRVIGDQLYGPGRTGWVTHHVDVNSHNNNPTNLQRLTEQEHRAVHAELCARSSAALKTLWNDPKWRAEQVDRIHRGHQRPDVQAKMRAWWASDEWAEMARNRARPHARRDVTFEVIDAEYRREPKTRKAMATVFGVDPAIISLRVKAAGFASWTAYTESVGDRLAPVVSDEVRESASRRMSDWLHTKWQDATYRAERSAESADRLNRQWADDEWAENQRAACKAGRWNHKVVSVTSLDLMEDVYDITVAEHHNFALDAGAFVHNCQEEEQLFYGKSYFEAAFYHWDKKVRLYFVAHLAAQRAATGTRVGHLPPSPTPEERKNFTKALSDLGFAQYLAVPDGYSVELLKEGTQFDFLSFINHHNNQMSKSILAPFFDDAQGGGASETTLVDFGRQSDAMFILMLDTIMAEVESFINDKIIPRFIDWNFDSGLYPKFRFGPLTAEQKGIATNMFNTLAVVSPEFQSCTPEFMHELEKQVAEELGLEIDYETVEERMAESAKLAEAEAKIAPVAAPEPATLPGGTPAGGSLGPSGAPRPGRPVRQSRSTGAPQGGPGPGHGVRTSVGGTTRFSVEDDPGEITLSGLARELLLDAAGPPAVIHTLAELNALIAED